MANGQRLPGKERRHAESYSLGKLIAIETKCLATQDKDMEFNNSSNTEISNCQVSIAESVNNLRFNKIDDKHDVDDDGLQIILKHDKSPKSGLLKSKFRTTGAARIGHTNSLSVLQNSSTTDLTYESNDIQDREETPLIGDTDLFSLPVVNSCDMRVHHISDGVPSITVHQDREYRVTSKPSTKQELDPNFLMPTESSVEEARYMLASRRRSFPCIGQNMPRTSLDMVIEEQSCETPDGDKGLTSLTSLGVPRHRSRSRSLDNTLETNNSFAAFKESLKVRNVKRKVLGT